MFEVLKKILSKDFSDFIDSIAKVSITFPLVLFFRVLILVIYPLFKLAALGDKLKQNEYSFLIKVTLLPFGHLFDIGNK